MNYIDFKNKFLIENVIEYPSTVSPKVCVSIILLTHNHKEYISKCIDSILSQKTKYSFEIILADDDSHDGTREICKSYAKAYPDKVRFFEHRSANNIKIKKLKTGLFSALYSLFEANGTYICYCDGDDYWTDDKKIEKQVEFLCNNEEYILSYHDVKFLKNDQELLSREKYENNILNREELLKVVYQPLLNTICFRNKIENYPIEITKTLNSDNFLISLLGNYGKGIFLTEIKPSVYRVHPKGIWSMISREKKLLQKINTYDNLAHYYQNRKPSLSSYFNQKKKTYKKSLVYMKFIKGNILKSIYYYFKY